MADTGLGRPMIVAPLREVRAPADEPPEPALAEVRAEGLEIVAPELVDGQDNDQTRRRPVDRPRHIPPKLYGSSHPLTRRNGRYGHATICQPATLRRRGGQRERTGE